MTQQISKIPISSIILDEDIYPRKGIDPRRVGIFAENIRDGFKFEPVEVEPDPGMDMVSLCCQFSYVASILIYFLSFTSRNFLRNLYLL